MNYARITGTGAYLPKKILTNKELETLVETSDEWIQRRVGIRQRHVVEDGEETTSSMATKAAEAALKSAYIDPADIDMVLVGTASADHFFPSTACILQKNLGINNECPAFDLNAACAGFIYCLNVAEQFIRSGSVKNVLIVGVDALSRAIDWQDRSTCVLFGDGAGAVVLSQSSKPGILATHLHASGEYADLLYAHSSLWKKEEAGIIHMKGREVFKIAVTKLGDIVEQTVKSAGLKKEDVDWLIPHQANVRIITATAKRLELPMERVILTVEEHGNTSAASIPLALDIAVKDGRVQPGQNILLEAFGAGLAWGSTLIRF